jgi:uncharacterized protein
MESRTRTAESPPVPEVALGSKVSFLRRTSSFPEATYRVEAIETHMSWVFLTGQHAYKLKKPVCYRFLNFLQVDARRRYCEEELRLNRRLAPGVYLGIVQLTLNSSGHLQLDGRGDIVDWLVKMRRLPMHRMLDYCIKNRTVGREDAARLAARLAGFYRNCPPVHFGWRDYRSRFESQIRTVLEELSFPAYQLPLEKIKQIGSAQLDALDRMTRSFDERLRSPSGRIVEGHGDLRPEHVCLEPGLPIIDCLEFSRDLRVADTADELGFLMLECERLGATDFANVLLQAYTELSGDRPKLALTHFYRSCRASLRAMLTIRHLNEETFRYSPEWRHRAEEYLKLAQHYISKC